MNYSAELTSDEYLKLVEKPARSKYNNRRTVVDGITFDSQREASDYAALCIRQREGEIHSLRLQPRYELQPSFKRDGKTIRRVEYVGDFEFIEDGVTVCADSKGAQTAVFKLKWKWVQYRYPAIRFVLL